MSPTKWKSKGLHTVHPRHTIECLIETGWVLLALLKKSTGRELQQPYVLYLYHNASNTLLWMRTLHWNLLGCSQMSQNSKHYSEVISKPSIHITRTLLRTRFNRMLFNNSISINELYHIEGVGKMITKQMRRKWHIWRSSLDSVCRDSKRNIKTIRADSRWLSLGWNCVSGEPQI
jgi:hypothetical protein